MNTGPIFISHATKDDAFVKELRLALEGQRLSVWVDSRNLRGGSKLAPEISAAIEAARQFIVVISPNTVNSPWVRKEIQQALEVEQRLKDEGYRVIPLLLPGIEPSALALWFDEEPVAVPIQLRPGGLSEMLPSILAALGEQLPDDRQGRKVVAPQPVEDLVLELSDITINTEEGKRRVAATAKLVYDPANPTQPDVESKRYRFVAPLGPIEADELRWYLEQFHLWPTGIFEERARRVEKQLPEWGKALYQTALGTSTAQEALNAWKQATSNAERRFSVRVDSELPEGTPDQEQTAARAAASDLLTLPWELLHDGQGYLFQGQRAVRVRRRLPNRYPQAALTTDLPIRVLLVSPRPEQAGVGYFDHRSSALPLVEAVESLGALVELEVLNPPTFPAMQAALKHAQDAGEDFDVVHFDGHGVYDHEHGLGALCFEDPKDVQKIEGRAMQLIDAEKMAEVIRDYRIPLVFLDACQTAKVEDDPTASVAAKLLEKGVTSVVAMSHSVLVETAKRFVKAFYAELARGARIGGAMLAGQRALYGDTHRGKIMGAGDLRLQDWFVPVLYQEANDPQLITELLPEEVQRLEANKRRLMLGALPEPPQHHFQGRSRELLALERLLAERSYVVVRGQGGAGKTTLAIELARWLVRTRRFRRAAFASVEHYTDARGVLDTLGRQLLPEGNTWSVAHFPDLKAALQPVERALRDHPTIIVLDNLESVLPDASGQSPVAAPVEELFELCQALLAAHPTTRLIFTSRETLPAPFDHRGYMAELGALSQVDAIELVSQVMALEGLTPAATDPGGTAEEITALVEAANRHARALVLLAREVARQGVRATTDNLHHLMAELDRKHPGDRENSLYASVELSLRRLPEEMREQVKALGVFHGGAQANVIVHVLEIDLDKVLRLGGALIGVGLAQDMGYGHLRLDPALPPYLLGQMDEEERERLRARWGEGMLGLTGFLYRQHFQDAKLAAQLTILELSNLLAFLTWAENNIAPEQIVDVADSVEALLSRLGRPKALLYATSIRERAAQKLRTWSNAQFLTERATIERLLEQDNLQKAFDAAQRLLSRALAEGEAAYEEAVYNIAMAHWLLGRVLKRSGRAEQALQLIAQAQQRFQNLANANNPSAAHMAAIAFYEAGDCLKALGRLDEAISMYEEGIRQNQQLNATRDIAVGKVQLGSVRLIQQKFEDALKAYQEARERFEALGEPRTVGAAWHQIGTVYRMMQRFDQAEHAYRQSLAINVRENDRANEANSLGELGLLYESMYRLEEAASFHEQTAVIFAELGNMMREGYARNNLANTLIKLRRYEEAHRELLRAIECKQPYGHAALPWTTWIILHDLEQTTNNTQAAAQARHQAIQAYLAYRRDGGENQEPGAQICALAFQAIQQGQAAEAEQWLNERFGKDAEPWAQAMAPKLIAILHGDRDPALAEDPALEYDDAVELMLLLERLGK